MSLFRSEVKQARADRVQGEVVLTQPHSSHLLVVLLVAVVVVAGGWFAFGSYARTETARGILVTDQPTVKVFAPRPGIAVRVYPRDGAFVEKGSPLLLVDVDTRNQEGVAPAQSSMATADQQLTLGRMQVALARQNHDQERGRLVQAAAAAERQRRILEEQLALQMEVVASHEQLFNQMNAVIERGFISRAQFEQRRQVLLTARQSASGIEQRIADLDAQAAQARTQIGALGLARDREVAGIESSMLGHEQQRLEFSGARSFVITAPASGRVTALQTAPGQSVTPQRPVLMIVPAGAALQADIYAPTRAIGFVRPGQEARLLYDAFPYTRFGSFRGRVQSVSRTVLDPRETDVPLQLEEPVYRIRVALDSQAIVAHGGEQQLQPGMTLTANLVLERRSFFQWLLAPLYAVINRA